MKKTILFLPCFLALFYLQAQNPFAPYKKKVLVGTLTNGKYAEFHDHEEIVEIGNVLFNTQTNKIVAYTEEDTIPLQFDKNDVSMFLSVDPLAYKYPSLSPYVYCNNNPIRYIDPTGMTIEVAGDDASTSKAVEQMQSRSKNLTFSRHGETGMISATGKAKTREEKYMMKIINDKEINVKINAQDHNEIDDNFVINGGGGAFMGNTVTIGASGKATNVEASQYVNVNSLAKSDKLVNSSGNFIWHEIAEGFEAGKISFSSGDRAHPVLPDIPNPIYNDAHYNAGKYFPGTIKTTIFPPVIIPDPKNWFGGDIAIPRKEHLLTR